MVFSGAGKGRAIPSRGDDGRAAPFNSRFCQRVRVAVGGALVGLALATAAAAEAPPLPSSFFGDVEIDGLPAPAGTEVSAWLAGQRIATSETLSRGVATSYRLDVPGDRDETPEQEGAGEGETIEIRVGGALAATFPWHSGTYVPLPLAADSGADLGVTIDDGVVAVAAGGLLTATVTAANGSLVGATGVELVVELPTGATLAAASDGGAVGGDGRLHWPPFALGAGAATPRTFSLELAAVFPAGVEGVTLAARIAHDGAQGSDANPANDTASDVDELEAAPDLVLALADDESTVSPGSTLVYRATITNPGTQGATGVLLEATLPAGAELFSTSHGGAASGGVVRWPLFPLPTGATQERAVTLRLPADLDPAMTALELSATVADDGSNGSDLDPADNLAVDHDAVHHAADLVALALSDSAVVTDPLTLALSGAVSVDLVNAGTLPSGPFVTVVFSDADGDGAYDPEVDPLLGSASRASLEPAGSAWLDVPVAGTVPFLGDRLFAHLDAEHEVVELSEANNVSDSSRLCGALPPPESFAPEVELSWPPAGGPASHPRAVDSLSTPLVVQLTDDNGDGLWNELDVPDLVFVSADLTYLLEPQVALRAIRGDTGAPIFDVEGVIVHPTNPQLLSFSGLAAGDIDNDGKPEILSTTFGPAPTNVVRAYEHTGALKWVSEIYRTHPSPAGSSNRDNPTIADLDGDGFAEIQVGANVFDRFGHLLWRGNAGQAFQSSGNSGDRGGAISVAADVDLDGRLEVVTGNTLYRWNGEIAWQVSLPDGYPAVANFDQDPQAEIVVVAAGTVRLHDTDGTLLWGPVPLPGSDPEAGGPPTVGDFDGDGEPEIGVAGSDVYVAFDGDGTILWQAQTQDYSSNLTGSTAFDFDGDGRLELIYRDERRLRVYRGSDGQVLFEAVLSSNTQTEEPVVADVDRDGNAEIVVTSDRAPDVPVASGERTYGLRVFGDSGDGWVAARGIWNQHAYTPELVDEDSGAPADPEWGWLTHNTFRANLPPGGNPAAAPDLTASRLLVDLSALPEVAIVVRIGNGGRVPVGPGLPVTLFDGDPSSGGAPLATLAVPSALPPGGWVDLGHSLPLESITSGELFVVADHDGARGRERECDEENNVASAPLDLAALGLWLTLDDGTAAVGAGDEVDVTLTVHNGFAGTATGVALASVLPPHTELLAASHGGSLDGGVVDWPLFALVSGGAAVRTMRYRVDPSIPLTVAALTLEASVADDGAQGSDPSPGNNFAADVNQITSVTAEAGGPYATEEGTPVALDGSGSFDRDGALVAWAWDLDGDGAFDDASGATATWVPIDEGTFTVRLRVTDDSGEIDVDAAQVTVANAPPLVSAPAVLSGDEGGVLSLSAMSLFDPGVSDDLVATIDWGDGASETMAVESGPLAASHIFVENGTYAAHVCIGDGDGGTGCAAIALEIANLPPEVAQRASYDFRGWLTEELGTGGTAQWSVAGDGATATEIRNSEPTALVGDLPGYGVVEVEVRTTDADDDFIGILIGFSTGDFSNPGADYLLVDWKRNDQTSARRGLALSRVVGVPTAGELWAHFDAASNGAANGVAELARGATRGGAPWLRNTTYRFRIDATPGRLRVWVDDAQEIDFTGPVPPGRLALYDFSQAATTFTALDSSLVIAGEEGTPIALRARFADPGRADTHTASIAWGDGAVEPVPVADEPGEGEVYATHSYLDELEVEATVCVTDDEEAPGCAEVPVHVANLPPALALTVGSTGYREDPVSLAGSVFSDPGVLDLHVATIDWGDGTVEAAGVVESNGAGAIEATHSYVAPGTFPLELCVDDGDGGVDCAARSVVLVDRFMDLAVDKAVSVAEARPGQRVTYTLTARNPGTLPATGVVLTDVLPAHLVFVDATGGGAHLAGTTTWTLGALAPGAATSVTLRADVAASAPFGATVWNQAAVADDGAWGPDGDLDDNAAAVPLRLSDGVTPIVAVANPLTGTEGVAIALAGVTFTDTPPSQHHTATIDWGDGLTSAGTVSPASGTTGAIGGSHAYADDGVYLLRVCVTDPGAHTGCATTTANVANSLPVLLDPGPVDLHHWRAEEYPTGDPSADWVVAADGLSVRQMINSTPSVFVSPIPSFGVPLEGILRVGSGGAWDDDYIGFVLGFERGDASNPGAEWILVDWKQRDQAGGLAGLAVSRGWGTPDGGEFWVHTDLPVNGSGSGIEEVARAATLGRVRWVEDTDYRFRFDYGPNHLRVWVNDVLQFDLAGSFPEGNFAFYNFSQQDVLYRGFTIGEEERYEGEDFELLGPFTDLGPLDTFSAEVDWDDGTSTQLAPESVGGFGALRALHAYPDDGDFAIEACVADDDGGRDCGAFPLLVHNLPPEVVAGPDATVAATRPQRFDLATFVDPGRLDSHEATVSWGDGEDGAGEVVEDDGAGSVVAAHAYAVPGSYPVEVCVVDDDGGEGCAELAIAVLAAPSALRAEKTVQPIDVDGDGQVSPGDRLLYRIEIFNEGASAATSLRLVDPIPAHATIVPGSVLPEIYALGDDPVTVALPDLAPGASIAAQFVVTVDAPLPTGVREIVNSGTIESSELPPLPTDDPALPGPADPTRVPVVVTSTIALAKTAELVDLDGDGVATAGDEIHWRLEAATGGDVAASGLLLRDPVPAHATLVPGSVIASAGNLVSVDPLVLAVGDLAVGSLVTLDFRTAIELDLPAEVAAIENQAAATSNEIDTLWSDDPSTAAPGDPTVVPIYRYPSLSVAPASVVEGDAGAAPLLFALTLDRAVAQPVSVTWGVGDGSAVAGEDYLPTGGVVTIPAGETSAALAVEVSGDLVVELDETVVVTLTDPVLATVGAGTALGTIFNDDATALLVTDVAVEEGELATVTVALSQPSALPVSVSFESADGTATAGEDYVANSGTLAFAPLQLTGAITIVSIEEEIQEEDETLRVLLSAPTGAELPDPEATVSILDDDTPDCALACPQSFVVPNDPGLCGALVALPAPETTGECGEVSCAPAAGSLFPAGTTTVTCAASTAVVACSFEVEVEDVEAPVAQPPTVAVGNDPGFCAALIEYTPTASDNCGVVGPILCDPPSGATFPVGATPVACTAVDAAGNAATSVGSIEVSDLEPPALAACPADVALELPPGATSWPVEFEPPAGADNCPGLRVECEPASGSQFRLGVTTVVCTATDGSGLQADCDFQVGLSALSALEIPALSRGGLALLAAALALAGGLRLRRRSRSINMRGNR